MKDKWLKNVVLKKATIEDVPMLMEFQKNVMEEMLNKDMYAPSTEEDFLDAIRIAQGEVDMLYYGTELIAFALLNAKPRKEIIDKYELDDTDGVGIYDSVMVKKEYRGNKLQVKLTNYINDIAKNKYKLKKVVATVHPENIWSKNNFEETKYKALKIISIYNSTRIVYVKDLTKKEKKWIFKKTKNI